MPIERNDLETARFGVVCAHIRDAAAGPQAVEAAARAMGVQMLTLRLPTDDLARVHAYEAAGYLLMDTLVWYGRDLRDAPATRRAPPAGIGLRRATQGDAGAVSAVAQAAFRGYLGHYHADPRLDRAAADAAYVDWATTSTRRCSDAAPVLVAESAGAIRAFLTMRDLGDGGLDIVLNAVHPDWHGRGIYGALVDGAMDLARDLGLGRIGSSTQIVNTTPQRAWARRGFTLDRSVYTFHRWL